MSAICFLFFTKAKGNETGRELPPGGGQTHNIRITQAVLHQFSYGNGCTYIQFRQHSYTRIKLRPDIALASATQEHSGGRVTISVQSTECLFSSPYMAKHEIKRDRLRDKN